MAFFKQFRRETRALKQTLAALNKSQAIIEFALDGTILTANSSFLAAMGYTLGEIQGKHHSIFVEPAFSTSVEYQAFWAKLRRGEYQAAQFRRFGKNGRVVWIEASYNPILDADGTPFKVVKFATDITRQKINDSDCQGQISAISKSQAVIEFAMDGTIITANANFLAAMGYDLAEIEGRHHSLFMPPGEEKSEAYRAFWAKLGRGEYHAGQFKRMGKNGREIWIEASYNPILDLDRKPCRVVKFATDVTHQKLVDADYHGQVNAISRAQAVIQFTLDGTILDANEGFLKSMGYRLDEIIGKHHSIFVDPAFKASEEYRKFWEVLRSGQFESRVYRRIGKHGKEVWIQASYNPILDLNGKPYKVVKYATDVTDMISLTETTNQNVQAVAAATEQLSASIDEISHNTDRSRQATDEIVTRTETSGAAADSLVNTTQSMGNIVALIRNIADQVNLLALNATIEAARAGAAGKGFAVVASEIKNLAKQTATATDEIAREIDQVQAVSAEVVTSIQKIIESTASVAAYVNSVAAALQQQNEATKEISHSSQKASQAVGEIASRIRHEAG